MRKIFFLYLLVFFQSGVLCAQQVYQLPNGGFETWYCESNSANSIVPTGFNSYYSGNGSLIHLMAVKLCDSSRDVRIGATGIYSLRLFSTSTLGMRNAGNVTTGRINAGSMTFASPENYNFSDFITNVPKYCQEFTGTPDSMNFWVKYLPGRNQIPNITDKGRIRAYIHGTAPCRDAHSFPSGMTEIEQYYGKAVSEFYMEDGDWNNYQVPFVYDGINTQKNNNDNYYILLTMVPNSIPGGGANNPDQVWFDDIVFIYNKRLADLQVNGISIPEFHPDITQYEYYNDCTLPEITVTATAQSPNNPTVEIEQATCEKPIATVTVTHGGESKIYTILFANCDTVAIRENDFEQVITLFPNPAGQYVTISASQNVSITDVKIFDIRGTLVIHEPYEFADKKNIALASLHKGIYLVRVETNKGIVMKRLLIQ